MGYQHLQQPISLTALVFAAGICLATPVQAITISNFSWASGTPASGSTTIDGVGITLTSTETEAFGTGIRDNNTDNTATISLSFDTAISEFQLDVDFVRNDEFIQAFNIGLPDTLSGELTISNNAVTTSLPFPEDTGAGSLNWAGLNATVVSFEVTTPDGAALAMTSFGFTARDATIPEPSGALLLFGVACVVTALLRRRAHLPDV